MHYHMVLLLPPWPSAAQRMVELALEHYGVQGVAIGVQAQLALYSHGSHAAQLQAPGHLASGTPCAPPAGMNTGIVLDCGDGVSHCVRVQAQQMPGGILMHKCCSGWQVGVVDGHVMPHLTRRLDLAGRHLTDRLMDLLIR